MDTTTTKVFTPLKPEAQEAYKAFGLAAPELLTNEHIEVIFVDPAGEPFKPNPEMLNQSTYKFVADDQDKDQE